MTDQWPQAPGPLGPPSAWPAPDPAGAAGPPSAWPTAAPPGTPGSVAPPPPPGRRGPKVLALVAAVAVAMVLLLVAGLAVLRTRDLEEAAPEPTTTTTAPPPGTAIDPGMTLPSIPGLDPSLGGADPEELARPLEEVLPDIITFVEQVRGHRFTSPPQVEAVGDAEFEERLAEAQAAEVDTLRQEQVAARALGLIPPDTDLVEVAERTGAAGVLGFYDPIDATLLVKGDVITPLVQTVIAHELTHALDDQEFDLDRLEALVERPDESAFGFLSVVEGTARFVEEAYGAQLSPEEQQAVQAEQLQLGIEQMLEISDLPPTYLVSTQIPYGSGVTLVRAVHSAGGTAGIDAAFDDPPTTSEQVLEPSLYADREAALPVPAPSADATPTSQGSFGAVDVRTLGLLGDPLALLGPASTGVVDPVVGFGGGAYVSWTEGGRSCIRVHLTGDTAGGDQSIRDVLATWQSAAPADAVISDGPTAASGRPVIAIRSCA